MLNSKNTKISVFGSSGFVGSGFCHLYRDEVIKILRDDYEPKSENVLYLISKKHNHHVFSNPQLYIDTNLSVMINVLENCKNKNLVFNFISSYFVYGECKIPANESTFCNPKGFYSITKKCAEDLLISYCRTFHIPYRILRLCNVYGKVPGKELHKNNALHTVIQELKNHRPIKLYYFGDFLRDYTHINDVAKAIKLVLECAPLNSIINIGSGISHQFGKLIKEAQRITGSQSVIEECPPPELYTIAEVKDIFLDVTKLTSLGFKPTVTIEEGIVELCR